MGHGLTNEVELEVPVGTLGFWGSRLESYGVKLSAIERGWSGEEEL